MTVNISKPALNLREKLAELDKPSGIAGEAMLRADSVQEQRNLLQVGRKNLIINGRGFVDQRAKSGVAISAGGFALDRWSSAQAATTFTQLSGGGFKSASTYASTWSRIVYKVEDCYNIIGTKQVTLSFDIKWNTHSGNGNSMVYLKWLQANGTETGTATTADISKVGLSGKERFSATFTIPSDATTPKHLMILFYGAKATASTWDFELDNVQLELGSVATDFEHRSYGEELALCQRYYERVIGTNATGGTYLSSHEYIAGSNSRLHVAFKTTMRVTPTITHGNWTDGSPATQGITNSGVGFYQASSFRMYAGSAGYINADAEL